MKIYGYHLVNTGLTPTLYAITNRKELSKRFERERDMNKFIVTVLDDCSKKDWMFYAERYRNNILQECTIRTRSDFTDVDRKTVGLLCTCEEEERSVLGEKYVADRLSKSFAIDTGFLKMNFAKALAKIAYFTFDDSPFHGVCPQAHSQMISNKFEEMGFALDELNIFLELFGETYKI